MDEPITYKYAYDHGITPEELADQKIRAAKSQAFDSGWEAGVQAERERIEARIEHEFGKTRIGDTPVDLDSYLAGVNRYKDCVRAALAVVTGKEGSSDE